MLYTRFEQFKPSGRTVNGLRVAFGIDIDGCVDPGMLKHEDGFATVSVQDYGLQMITGIAKRAWMFVNCFSNDRGITRFRALFMWADLLLQTPAAVESGVDIPTFKYLRRWCDVTNSYSPEALYNYLAEGDFSGVLEEGDSRSDAFVELHGVYEWSSRINENVGPATEHMTAFPHAVTALKRAHELGVDLCAVSGTPEEHVVKQLEIYGVLDCFIGIFAQQAGKKSAALATMMAGPDFASAKRPVLENVKANYDVILMIGDAPKDHGESLTANEILTGSEDSPCRMYFIEVDHENQSWKTFNEEVLDQVIANTWKKEHEADLVGRGLANLDRVWDPDVAPIDTFARRT
ncbi:MAG: HAD family hydrolase [Planctomycetota bacterium]|nr:HAD family hydrolase [Planctomycetota bacterium]